MDMQRVEPILNVQDPGCQGMQPWRCLLIVQHGLSLEFCRHGCNTIRQEPNRSKKVDGFSLPSRVGTDTYASPSKVLGHVNTKWTFAIIRITITHWECAPIWTIVQALHIWFQSNIFCFAEIMKSLFVAWKILGACHLTDDFLYFLLMAFFHTPSPWRELPGWAEGKILFGLAATREVPSQGR